LLPGFRSRCFSPSITARDQLRARKSRSWQLPGAFTFPKPGFDKAGDDLGSAFVATERNAPGHDRVRQQLID